MLGSGGDRRDEVTCIACGETVARDGAREYDKHGDRWSRNGKEFEFLCKSCHADLCHQPRDGLERRLVEARAGEADRDSFLAAFVAEDRSTARERDE